MKGLYKAFIELFELLTSENKKSHAGKKAGGAMARKSWKKLRKAF